MLWSVLDGPGVKCVFCCACRCGSGLSGDYLTEEGHLWVGVDISTAMLGESNSTSDQ